MKMKNQPSSLEDPKTTGTVNSGTLLFFMQKEFHSSACRIELLSHSASCHGHVLGLAFMTGGSGSQQRVTIPIRILNLALEI